MSKKKLIVLFSLILCLCNIFAQTNDTTVQKGKIIIVVLDVSGSIQKQFGKVIDVIDKSIVERRLNVGDYFVLIKFSNEAVPMYAGQLMRIDDKKAISNNLRSIKADGSLTDIGEAMSEALRQIVSLKQQDFNLYEPLVLFITDGDIQARPRGPFNGKTAQQLFDDPLIGNNSLYGGWYYVGIKTDKELHDLPIIAKMSGREDYLLNIEDLSTLEKQLDDWIKQIPESQPLEQAEITLTNFALSSAKIRSGKEVTVPVECQQIFFSIFSNYKRTTMNYEFVSANGIFQSEDNKQLIPIKLTPEAGRIILSPMSVKATSAAFEPSSEIYGKGTLKLTFNANVNGIDTPYDYTFKVNFKKSSEILFSRIITPLIIILVIIGVIVLIMIIKKFMPVKIYMDVVGTQSNKKTVSVSVGRKIDFGSKSSAAFKMDSEQFAQCVGQFQRVGADSYQIIPKASAAFDGEMKNIKYLLGSPLKLKNRDDSVVTIKFRKK